VLDFIFSMNFELVTLFIIGGLGSGLITGFLGAGGGLILVPLLLYILSRLGAHTDVAMHQAISTSLSVMVFSTLSATIKQYRCKLLSLDIFLRWCPFVITGTLLAVAIYAFIPDQYLKIIFVIYLILVALYMGIKKDPVETELYKPVLIPKIVNAIAGIVVGGVSKLLGIGGATITVPFYIYFNYDMKSAIALSSATSLIISATSTIAEFLSLHAAQGLADYSRGYVNLPSLLLITPPSMIAAHYGVVLNHRISDRVIKWLYISSLLFVSFYISYGLVGMDGVM
jgi:uncharacterized protein